MLARIAASSSFVAMLARIAASSSFVAMLARIAASSSFVAMLARIAASSSFVAMLARIAASSSFVAMLARIAASSSLVSARIAASSSFVAMSGRIAAIAASSLSVSDRPSPSRLPIRVQAAKYFTRGPGRPDSPNLAARCVDHGVARLALERPPRRPACSKRSRSAAGARAGWLEHSWDSLHLHPDNKALVGFAIGIPTYFAPTFWAWVELARRSEET
jgi:hypothetical protein